MSINIKSLAGVRMPEDYVQKQGVVECPILQSFDIVRFYKRIKLYQPRGIKQVFLPQVQHPGHFLEEVHLLLIYIQYLVIVVWKGYLKFCQVV